MTQTEYNDMIDSGVVPTDARRCVLCESYHVTKNYLKSRLVRSCGTGGDDDGSVHVAQAFTVKVDQRNGYASKFCIAFARDINVTNAGVIAPMVLPQLQLLEAKVASDGTRYITQDRLMMTDDSREDQYF